MCDRRHDYTHWPCQHEASSPSALPAAPRPGTLRLAGDWRCCYHYNLGFTLGFFNQGTFGCSHPEHQLYCIVLWPPQVLHCTVGVAPGHLQLLLARQLRLLSDGKAVT